MSSLGFLSSIADALLDVIAPLQAAMASPAAMAALLQREGWRPPDDAKALADLKAALAVAGDVDEVAEALAGIDADNPSIDELRAVLDSASKLLTDLKGVARPSASASRNWVSWLRLGSSSFQSK